MLVPLAYFAFGWEGQIQEGGGKYWYPYQFGKRRVLEEEEEEVKTEVTVIELEKPSFEELVKELLQTVLETGVVKNKHLPYSPVFNPRLKVTLKQARAIAYTIAKKHGYRITNARKELVRKFSKTLSRSQNQI